MSWILYALSGYDPDKDARGPLKEERKRTADSGTALPKNVKPNVKTRWLEQTDEREEHISWENLNAPGQTDNAGRNTELSQQDIDYIQHFQKSWEHLTLKRAEELKPFWAHDYTAKGCADLHQNRRGYKQSTIEKYWRVFNKNPSPIE